MHNIVKNSIVTYSLCPSETETTTPSASSSSSSSYPSPPSLLYSSSPLSSFSSIWYCIHCLRLHSETTPTVPVKLRTTMDKPTIQISKWKKGNDTQQSKNFGAWTKHEHFLFYRACIQHGWGNWKRIEKKIPTRDRNQVKSHARNIGIDIKQRIIRDHSIYKQGKNKMEQKKLSTNKHHDESTKEDSASIIDKITMSRL